MSKIIGKAIHIPSRYNGNRYGYPEIVYVLRYHPHDILGSTDPNMVEQGRFRSFPLSRCIPFSEEIWEKCQNHIEKRLKLERDYQELEKIAGKKFKKG